MATASSPLDGILAHLHGTPSRSWSIVITVFGDAVVPRGGSVWLGTLLPLFQAMGIGGGALRTAMSRLTADDWLHRTRQGRHSFYTLTDKGRASFATAAPRIYAAPPAAWDGQFEMVLGQQPALREALEAAGFGSLAPGVWIAPTAIALPPLPPGALLLHGSADLATGRQLAGQAWKLERTATGYRRFVESFAPLGAWLAAGARLAGLEALVARTLLIHEYRRVVLRDPRLPVPLLPEHWPGAAARRLCAEIYGAVLAESELWLDAEGRDAAGALPPPSLDLRTRFAEA